MARGEGTEVLEIAERVLGEGGFSVEKFVESFPVLVEAAAGITRLRGLILDAAVRGRLVASDPPCSPEGGPFAIPRTWRWTTIGEASVYVQRGKGPAYVESSRIPVVSQKCVQWEGFLLDRARFIDPDSLQGYAKERFLLEGDLLWNSTGHGTVGRVAVFRADARYPRVVADSHVTIIRLREAQPRYVWCWLASPTVQGTIDSLVSGTTKQTELATSTVLAHPVPLPPLAEQKRIVARVDQLMALIDQLEAKQNRKRDLGARFTKASLEALTTAESPQDFTTAWTRIHQTWPTLLDHPDKVGNVRRAILEMGIQGRLVRQLASDEPAATLLSGIGVQPTGTESGSVEGESPQGWERVQIGKLAVVKSGTTLAPELECASGDWPYLKIADMNLPGNEKEAVLSSRYVRDSDELRRYLIDPGSIIFPKRGGAIATNKKRMVRRPILVDLNTMAITCPHEMCFEYVYLWFLTIDLAELDNGTSVPQINHKDISPLLIPIPPFAEQKRIVAKVEHLVKLCDALEAALRRSEERAAKLAEAVVQAMVA